MFTFLTEHFEGDTSALQAFLGLLYKLTPSGSDPLLLLLLLCVENTLLSSSKVARSIRRLSERQLTDGYQLVNKINSMREKLLVGVDQVNINITHIIIISIWNLFTQVTV